MANDYKKIIVALDGSKEADWAFKKACEIAKRNDGQLYLVHIIDMRSFATLEAYDQTIAERASNYAKEMLENYKNEALKFGVHEPEIIMEYGSPKVKISKDIAQNVQADLIVCGATGLNAVERFLIGSVSEHIVRYAHCDVLVVRTNKDD
ncbi:universal stress protein [Fervidibacillus halotolerans]|uniref:Universal stress protein n=1 Tax=Fervidibacillus halotolerans TaxID=2980027 RepID=A0A9E8LXU5_9BACI|nr:universal stress protein [Fervidibacillus halotolerans]WAA11680.1 universal stress protein [Fervidibacillus halotolerans]